MGRSKVVDEFKSDEDFVRSLNSGQQAYFLKRETEIQVRLQSAVQNLARGLGEVSGLNGECQALIFASLAGPGRV